MHFRDQSVCIYQNITHQCVFLLNPTSPISDNVPLGPVGSAVEFVRPVGAVKFAVAELEPRNAAGLVRALKLTARTLQPGYTQVPISSTFGVGGNIKI